MYNNFFGLQSKPFSIAPDPHYLFMSEQHREALAHLMYGVGEGGGFVLLTGEVGTGKTTVCRCLLQQLPENTQIAFILNPKLSATELLESACDELHIPCPEQPSLKQLTDLLNNYLLAAHAEGRQTVLMIDEAQNLSIEVLEQVRLLTNLETDKQKLLQIILIGQPELREVLSRHELRQLAQRITARYHLRPLTMDECTAYIKHRLAVSGLNDDIFETGAIQELYRRSGGVPRLLNVLCDRAMLGAYSKNSRLIDVKMIKRAAAEIMAGDERNPQADVIQPEKTPRRTSPWLFVLIVLIVVPLIIYGYVQQQQLQQTLLEQQQRQAELQTKTQQASQANQALQSRIEALQEQQRLREQQLLPFLPPELKPIDFSLALRQLLGPWDMADSIPLGADVCESVRTMNRRCETFSGDWDDIIRLDRPAILHLTGQNAKPLYGLLQQVQGDQVLVDFSGTQILVTRQQLAPFWSGRFTFLWQAPPDYDEPLRLDSQGLAVQWLKTQLSQLNGVDMIVPPNVVYDLDLQFEVLKFQKKYGLQPDAVAGIETLVTINSLVSSDQPTLAWREAN